MTTIVEALKAKNPNATGSTIAEVLMSYNTLDEALAASDNYEGAGSAPLIIDKDLRKVNIPTNYVLGVYNDKDVLNVPFVLPRYYHGLDLSTFDIKINWQNAAGVKNYTEASDIVVDEDVVNFNWLLGAGVFTKAGSVNFVVCVRKVTDKGLIEREINTTTCSATVLEGLEAEDPSDPDQYSILVQMRGYAVDAEYYATQAENSMREAAAYVGSPLKAATVSDMTNTEKVYVYTGSESGYTNGNWYYYDGSAWVSGGVYNSTAIELDTELTSTTKPAQGKKTGDEIADLKADLNNFNIKASKTFSKNYGIIPCFIKAGMKVTVKTIDGNNFTGGTIFFTDINDTRTHCWSLPTTASSRELTFTKDSYKMYIGGEQNPENIIISPVLDYEDITKVVGKLGTPYACVTGATGYEYNISTHVLDIKANSLVVFYGGELSFNHAKIIEDLGTEKAYETDGNLNINVGASNMLLYDVVDNKLKIISNVNYTSWRHIPLFVTRYNGGASGLLVTPNLDLTTRAINSSMVSLQNDFMNFYNNYKKNAKSSYAFLSNGGLIKEYSVTGGSFSIGQSAIRAFINGQSLTFAHADIISQLGATYAYEDTAGNLTIKLGNEYALVYNTSTSALQRVLLSLVNQEIHVLLFTVYYTSGSVGLLAENDNNLRLRASKDVTPARLLNSSPSFYDVGIESNLTRYEKAVLSAGTKNEQFILFSDPHCFQGDYEANMLTMMSTIQKYYNCSSADFVLCGGDWLGNSDTLDSASYKLGLIKGIGKSMLGGVNFYNIIGNHDTNYQGTPTLTEDQLSNIWFSGEKCYYKIKRKNCTFYALDTGLDNDNTLTAYRYEQLKWMCDALKANDDEHNAIFLHIVFTNSADPTLIAPMATKIGDIITAYNGRSSITIDGTAYDFSECNGKIEFVLCGHVHADFNTTLGGVPCISEINTGKGGTGTASFDLCIADFDNKKITMVRVGSGEDREFTLT